MTNRPLHNLDTEGQHYQQAEYPSPTPRSFYAALCALEELQWAYAHIAENSQKLGIDTFTLKTIGAEGIETFLQQLSDDLQAQTYRPAQRTQQPSAMSAAESEGRIALRDLVVQVALKRLLETAFPPDFPSDPEPEKTIQWLAGNIDKGLTRTYALNISECLDVGQQKRLVERASQRIGDPQLIGLLKEIVTAPAQPGNSPQGFLAPVLTDITFESIDQILQQARTLSHEGNFFHVQWTRVGNQLVVLSDHDPRYEWILPAVKERLHEELSHLHYDPSAVETQSVDLMLGEPLRFLDFELRCVQGKHGESRVQYRLVEEAGRRQDESASSRRRLFGRYHPLRFVQPYLEGVKHLPCWQLFHDVCHQLNSIQVGWRHLPIALCPVLLLVFDWRSSLFWLCFLSIFVCNWRWTLDCAGRLGGWAWRHKPEVMLGAGALTVLVGLYPFVSDLYANRSHEDSAPFMPPGFYLGQYNKGSLGDAELVRYGLYVPPHFQGQKGPFPLIVFLHGHMERFPSMIFSTGLPRAIARNFGPDAPNGRFDFVAFFPIDPKGHWQAGSPEVEDAMLALDYVMRRYRIDPARVYLTGVSVGGSGVWSLAQAYPDKWAAVAPVSSFISPDVAKVRHIPVWIVHGAKDPHAPIERERQLVRQLQEVQADVHYLELPDKQHVIWAEAYDSKELYDWFMTKKKD